MTNSLADHTNDNRGGEGKISTKSMLSPTESLCCLGVMVDGELAIEVTFCFGIIQKFPLTCRVEVPANKPDIHCILSPVHCTVIGEGIPYQLSNEETVEKSSTPSKDKKSNWRSSEEKQEEGDSRSGMEKAATAASRDKQEQSDIRSRKRKRNDSYNRLETEVQEQDIRSRGKKLIRLAEERKNTIVPSLIEGEPQNMNTSQTFNEEVAQDVQQNIDPTQDTAQPSHQEEEQDVQQNIDPTQNTTQPSYEEEEQDVQDEDWAQHYHDTDRILQQENQLDVPDEDWAQHYHDTDRILQQENQLDVQRTVDTAQPDVDKTQDVQQNVDMAQPDTDKTHLHQEKKQDIQQIVDTAQPDTDRTQILQQEDKQDVQQVVDTAQPDADRTQILHQKEDQNVRNIQSRKRKADEAEKPEESSQGYKRAKTTLVGNVEQQDVYVARLHDTPQSGVFRVTFQEQEQDIDMAQPLTEGEEQDVDMVQPLSEEQEHDLVMDWPLSEEQKKQLASKQEGPFDYIFKTSAPTVNGNSLRDVIHTVQTGFQSRRRRKKA